MSHHENRGHYSAQGHLPPYDCRSITIASQYHNITISHTKNLSIPPKGTYNTFITPLLHLYETFIKPLHLSTSTLYSKYFAQYTQQNCTMIHSIGQVTYYTQYRKYYRWPGRMPLFIVRCRCNTHVSDSRPSCTYSGAYHHTMSTSDASAGTRGAGKGDDFSHSKIDPTKASSSTIT